MHQVQPTIGEVSRQILQNFTRRELNDGRRIWDLEQNVDWQHEIIRNALQDPIENPEVCSSIFRILLEIFVASSQEEAEELLLEIEPSSDLRELTGWLHSSEKNIEYINQVLQIASSADGLTLLAMAQRLFLQDTGRRIIDEIQQYIHQKEYSSPALN